MVTLKNYAKLPLHFELNQGQNPENIDFAARGLGYHLSLAAAEAVLDLSQNSGKLPSSDRTDERTEPTPTAFLRIKPSETVERLSAEGLEMLPGKVNYFIGNDPNQWRTDIPTYAKVKYTNIYPSVDMIHYGNQGKLEWDFVVAPGGDPSVIKLSVLGSEGMDLNAEGDLLITAGGGHITLHKPVAYQIGYAGKEEVDCNYQLLGEDLLCFTLGKYDQTRELTIDPVLVYSTYLGGSLIDQGHDIAVDAQGNAYVTGETPSRTPIPFPTKDPLPLPNRPYFRTDAFITKFDAQGNLVYSTYLGGDGYDLGQAIAVDLAGNIYVAGTTGSPDPYIDIYGFPTFNAFQSGLKGTFDAFLSKISPAGNSLLYSTYFGGEGNDDAFGIAVDNQGHAYITGQTDSKLPFSEGGFPTTVGAYQAVNNSSSAGILDAFVAKLDTTKSEAASLVYSTYMGGAETDQGVDIAIDGEGNAYVAGTTNSVGIYPTGFPTTPGVFQTQNNSVPPEGSLDVFVTKINPTGSALIYSTYLGGARDDSCGGIALDAFGHVYVTGRTNSSGTYPSGFPTTPGAYQTENHSVNPQNNSDVFVAKLNIEGTDLIYSTYLGGAGHDVGRDIALDPVCNTYITGYTDSVGTYPIGFPTVRAIQVQNNGVEDVFVTKLNAAGNHLIYSTYLGGDDADLADAIAVDPLGNAYVTGNTASPFSSAGAITFPLANPFQPQKNSLIDAFVTKIFDEQELTRIIFDCQDITCPNDPGLCGASVTFAVSAFIGCSGQTLPVSCMPPSGTFFQTGITTVACTASDAIGPESCSFSITVLDTEQPSLTIPDDILVNTLPDQNGRTVNFSVSATDNCPGVTVTCDPPSGYFFPIGTTIVRCTATDAAGNTTSGAFRVRVMPVVIGRPVITNTIRLC